MEQLLCSPLEREEALPLKVPGKVQSIQSHAAHGSQGSLVSQWKPVPDKERKRPYKMSVTQRQKRREHEQYESQVQNLKLDINDLRQQIQHLLEYRDWIAPRA
ncbi:hypothetical protein PsorP6_010999 [Peronosclerospora sorghi]|uniref:Uncharacterized protein n=1 Tax=Peronosclerospora sorghi TaxID=230839 RepID=A0ACC0VX26_9STRA|nr:hypothetical protein PsorP6_010999 [Peronosclerospora sorghi]